MTTAKNNTLDQHLADFRARETVEQIFPLNDNVEAQRLISAWPNARIRAPKSRLGKAPADDTARWDWLWTKVEVDEIHLANLAGMSLHRLRAALSLVRGHHLIYPDGTVHQQATNFIRALVAKDLGVKPGSLARR